MDALETRLQDRLGEFLEAAMRREPAVVEGDRIVRAQAQLRADQVAAAATAPSSATACCGAPRSGAGGSAPSGPPRGTG